MTHPTPGRPADHADRPEADRAADQTTDRPTAAVPVPLEEAAARLGITPNAVRQRMKRGTLAGHKTAAGWVVVVPDPTDPTTLPAGDRPTTDHRPGPTSHRPTATDPAPAADLAPLAALIADLSRENRELATAAALWQERARTLEGRLQALTAGESGGDDVPGSVPLVADPTVPGPLSDRAAPGGRSRWVPPAPADPTLVRRPWWRRLLGG